MRHTVAENVAIARSNDSRQASRTRLIARIPEFGKYVRALFILVITCVAVSFTLRAIGQEIVGIPINEQARLLLRDAGRALVEGKFAEVLEKSTRVAQLLPDDARVQQRVGELLYRSGHVMESLKPFDRTIELNPAQADDNWQRGIALATAGEFEKGAQQFEGHHRVNPDDVENSAWHFLCVAKSQGLDAARKALLPSRGDGRQPMMAILSLYRQEKSAKQLLSELELLRLNSQEQQLAIFYAHLYLGLYYDALGMDKEALQFLKQSSECVVSGYMVDVARVYLSKRFKNTDSNADND